MIHTFIVYITYNYFYHFKVIQLNNFTGCVPGAPPGVSPYFSVVGIRGGYKRGIFCYFPVIVSVGIHGDTGIEHTYIEGTRISASPSLLSSSPSAVVFISPFVAISSNAPSFFPFISSFFLQQFVCICNRSVPSSVFSFWTWEVYMYLSYM